MRIRIWIQIEIRIGIGIGIRTRADNLSNGSLNLRDSIWTDTGVKIRVPVCLSVLSSNHLSKLQCPKLLDRWPRISIYIVSTRLTCVLYMKVGRKLKRFCMKVREREKERDWMQVCVLASLFVSKLSQTLYICRYIENITKQLYNEWQTFTSLVERFKFSVHRAQRAIELASHKIDSELFWTHSGLLLELKLCQYLPFNQLANLRYKKQARLDQC